MPKVGLDRVPAVIVLRWVQALLALPPVPPAPDPAA